MTAMTTKMAWSVLGAAVVALLPFTQDPQKPAVPVPAADPRPAPQQPQDRPAAPPKDAAPLHPIAEPYVEPIQRGDLPERYGTRDPIEGIWQLRSRSVASAAVEPGTGYMVVGRRHILVHFEAQGPHPDVPIVRANVFTWTRVDNGGQVRMTTVLGHFDDDEEQGIEDETFEDGDFEDDYDDE